MTYRLPRAMREALDATGKPWAVEERKHGTRLILDGRMIASLPRSAKSIEATPNCLASYIQTIRRATSKPGPKP